MSHLDRVTGQEDGVTLLHSPLSQQPAPSLQPSVYIQPAQASVKQPPASSCSRQYCLNGGTCVQLASGIKCSCQYHFSGSRCQGTVHVKLTHGGALCIHSCIQYYCEFPAKTIAFFIFDEGIESLKLVVTWPAWAQIVCHVGLLCVCSYFLRLNRLM